jgi:hypothetical protein
MRNRDIYLRDPLQWKLKNEGVARVGNDTSDEALEILRYELETFVCDGQYEKGMAHILETYLKNIDQADQPGVWVSGFYGSGKSHLVKMLSALWADTQFPDGATARGIVTLPPHVRDLLRELSIEGTRRGGLHAASGTLGSSAKGSVRLALLEVIFGSVGLPRKYPLARFAMWLKQEGLYDAVRSHVESSGEDWSYELDNLYVAELLHEALQTVRPSIFPSPQACIDSLNNLYPSVDDVSNDDMVQTMRQALSREGRFPLTLVVLDEVQQYIGKDSERAHYVQEAVETCCKSFGGRLLFIGTGQTGITGETDLRRLEGRFRVRVELSDADVDTVLRQVVLTKKPEAKEPLEQVLQQNVGEISRHLTGTAIAHRNADRQFFSQDYPLLPTRRRFWENALRALDRTGTDSQLRNQLSLVHKVIQTNVDQPLGHVIAADYLFFDAADRLLQTRALTRRLHEETRRWMQSDNEDERLLARACGLVFLINKLADSNREIGIKATVDTLADLLVEDLASGSSGLRSKLPRLLDETNLLMKVDDEYRIQTEESAAWNDDFMAEISALRTNRHHIVAERTERLQAVFREIVSRIIVRQGGSKAVRRITPAFGSQLPADADEKIYVWVRDGWDTTENSVRADARQAGSNSPTIFVFIPNRAVDELNNALTEYKAASATLEKRGNPDTPEGKEARRAMETRLDNAETKIGNLLDEAFREARVFQGGGNPVVDSDLTTTIHEAANHSVQRLYPEFRMADSHNWGRVYSVAREGAPDALKRVGYDGDVATHPVCKTVLSYIGRGKTGAEVRGHFEKPPYGWEGDAVDGAVYALLAARLIRVSDEHRLPLDHNTLDRRTFGRATFQTEHITVTTAQRVTVRRLLQRAGIRVSVQTGDEPEVVPEFLDVLQSLANQAGGEPPLPVRPDTRLLDELRLKAGNEQLVLLDEHHDELAGLIDTWKALADKINRRQPAWQTLHRLLAHAEDLDAAQHLVDQAEYIRTQRQLLIDPDPVTPLVQQLTQLLRDELNRLNQRYAARYDESLRLLAADSNWQTLDEPKRNGLLKKHRLDEAARPTVQVGSVDEVLATLERVSLEMFRTRIAALPARFQETMASAAKILEPEVQFVHIARRTLRTEADLEQWLADAREQLAAGLENGPVSVS